MTQTELDSLLAAVIGEAEQAGIPISSSISPTVAINHRARSRFGCCRRMAGSFQIEISAFLLEAEDRMIRQTLAHEVLHTCPGCADHGPRWKNFAARMNLLFGYRIRRADSPEALGVEDARTPRWLVVCTACGRELPRMKRSPLVLHPRRYRCACGGTLVVRAVSPSVK